MRSYLDVTMDEGRVFPSEWGPNCPPQDAQDANGLVFRSTVNDPPAAEDFLSVHELGIVAKYPQTRTSECRRRALSVYRTLKDARQHLELHQKRYKFIAKGVLTADCGKTKLIPSAEMSSHTEWWCCVGIDRTRGFETVKD
jgi:hypothetical protein